MTITLAELADQITTARQRCDSLTQAIGHAVSKLEAWRRGEGIPAGTGYGEGLRAAREMEAGIAVDRQELASLQAELAALETAFAAAKQSAEIDAFDVTENAVQTEGERLIYEGLRLAMKGVEILGGSNDRGQAFAKRLGGESSPAAARVYRIMEKWPTLKTLPLATGYLAASKL